MLTGSYLKVSFEHIIFNEFKDYEQDYSIIVFRKSCFDSDLKSYSLMNTANNNKVLNKLNRLLK